MLLHAKNGTIAMGRQTTDYVCFGSGDKTLLLLPGLSDGFKTVHGMALPLALKYRAFASAYKVYVISRADPLEPGYTTRDMARDVKRAMDALSIASASALGVSQGGMVAQYLALDFPACVEKLALAVTLSRPNRIVREAVTPWIEMAKAGDYRAILTDTAEKSYSAAYLRAHRWLLSLLGRSGKPADFSRFITEAASCLSHDAYDRLTEIRCPTLVLGGGEDRIVGADASREIADRIGGSEFFLYDGLGHAAYEEAGDFNRRLLDFFQKTA